MDVRDLQGISLEGYLSPTYIVPLVKRMLRSFTLVIVFSGYN